jgi:hypothetical protein
MSNTHLVTWNEVLRNVQEWARYDWRNRHFTDEDDVYQWAHETADGCEYVIYYAHQNELWNYPEVRQYEDGTYGDDIQRRIGECVYLAVYEACIDAALAVMQDDETSGMGVRTVERYVNIRGEGVTIPTLETYRYPREV